MNPSDEERALMDEYRQASADDAGRPGAGLRKAILAEAAAAASRRAPAVNDSRYLWRGVAGVAVLGFAILMWKQVDHHIPGDAPVIAARSEPPADVLLEAAPPAVATAETKPSQPASTVSQPPAAPPVAVAEIATDAAAPAGQAPAAEAESSAKVPASREMANAMQGAPTPAPAMAPAAERLRDEPARALGKMRAAQDAELDADALLRLHFLRQYQSDTQHSVWLVQDATGTVLRSGELAAGKTFGDIRPEIERELGGRLLRPWRIRSLQNARGQIIELAIAQTP